MSASDNSREKDEPNVDDGSEDRDESDMDEESATTSRMPSDKFALYPGAISLFSCPVRKMSLL